MTTYDCIWNGDAATRLGSLPDAARELLVEYLTVTVRCGTAPTFAVLFMDQLQSVLDRPSLIVPGTLRAWTQHHEGTIALLHREGASAYISADFSLWYNTGTRGTSWTHKLHVGYTAVYPVVDYALARDTTCGYYIQRGYPHELLARCPRPGVLVLGESGSAAIDLPSPTGWYKPECIRTAPPATIPSYHCNELVW